MSNSNMKSNKKEWPCYVVFKDDWSIWFFNTWQTLQANSMTQLQPNYCITIFSEILKERTINIVVRNSLIEVEHLPPFHLSLQSNQLTRKLAWSNTLRMPLDCKTPTYVCSCLYTGNQQNMFASKKQARELKMQSGKERGGG